MIHDIKGLTKYTKPHDDIMNLELVVVENVHCGLDYTPYDNGSAELVDGKAEDKLYLDYGIWKKQNVKYSVSVPSLISLSGWSTPDLSDGGYQHPKTNDHIRTLARQVTEKFAVIWDNPRNGNSLRFGFLNPQDAEAFIDLVKQEYKQKLGEIEV